MSDRATLQVVCRTVFGVIAWGTLLLGTFFACRGAFSQPKLLVGFGLVYLAGWVAFRRFALIVFFALYWLSVVFVAWVTSPWLALVTALVDLKPGTPRTVVVERLKPWILPERVPDANSSNWIFLELSGLSPEAITLSFENDRLRRAELYWD